MSGSWSAPGKQRQIRRKQAAWRIDRALLGVGGSTSGLPTIRIVLPETEDFLKADLRRDPAEALAKAEGEKK